MNKQFIENANTELNYVVQHLKNGDLEQAEELTRKIAFHIPKNKDQFWLDMIVTVIRSVILALAEDGVSAKREKVDMSSIVNFLESKQYALDDFFNSREDNSLAKNTYKPILFMAFETKIRIIGKAIISIKLRLQEVE